MMTKINITVNFSVPMNSVILTTLEAAEKLVEYFRFIGRLVDPGFQFCWAHSA